MTSVKLLFIFQLDVLFGNLTEMVEFQVEFLKTLEDGVRLVPDLEKLERVDQFKVSQASVRGGRVGRWRPKVKWRGDHAGLCLPVVWVPKQPWWL